jgi:two-component system NtrC family sensor kinase
MTWELKKESEIPTSITSVPPPPDDLRRVDRLATFGLLAAGVVHELGSTINAASIHAEVIANGEAVGEAARASARIVLQQLSRMTARLRRLLDFAEDAPPQRERTDIAALTRQVAELFIPLAGRRGITVRMPPAGRVDADVDPMQVEQVIANLVLNAIQASPDGSAVHVAVRRGTDGDEGTVRIEVTDDGPGIAFEHRSRIFEPFFTTKDTSGGTGLGLAVADAIVRAHDGWIDLESEPGKGATFRIHLPIAPSAPQAGRGLGDD